MTDLRATVYPKIKVNKCISLSSSVNFTSLGIHAGGRPYDNAATGTVPANQGGFFNSLWVPVSDRMAGANVPNMFVTVQWWKLSIKLPWFGISTGTKTSNVGLGFWKNKCQRASTSFGTKAHYGPFTIGMSPYFGRTRSDWDVFARDSMNDNNPWRKDDDRDYTRGGTVSLVYANGPFWFQFFQDFHLTRSYRQDDQYVGRNADGTPGAKPALTGIPHPDQWVSDAAMAIKYFNGRFFFNAEVDHFWQYRSGRGIAVGLFGPEALLVNQDQDQDAWMYAVELGTLIGPSKITLSYFRATGDDPATRKTTEDARAGDSAVSSCYVRDWAYLMYYYYGTGTSYDAEGKGQPTNLHHVGGRIDYAVASNLNVYGVFSTAWRDQPNAFRLGGNLLHTQHRFDNNDILEAQLGVGDPFVFAVPDHARDIGWEVDLGVNWKLIENLTWNGILAIWQPGNWWSYAYPNTAAIWRATPPGAPLIENDFFLATANLGRDIDPLIGFETTLEIFF
jgi:hypothetical protein